MPDAVPARSVALARSRWRAAEDSLYPTLITDPSTYQRALGGIQAVVGELRSRCARVEDLIAVEAAPDDLIATACPAGTALPATVLLAVACGMADREMAAEQERRRRAEVIADARRAGCDWAVLAGPARVESLTEGRRVELHLPSGAVVEATVDPWSGDEVYRIEVTVAAGDGQHRALCRGFTDRDDWLAQVGRCHAEVESGRPLLESPP